VDNKINRLLWWFLVSSLFIYVVVAHVVPLPESPRSPVTILFAALGAVSASVAVGSLLYRRHALSGPIQRGDLDPGTPDGQARAFPVFIVNLVLSESIGIYGLVLVLLSGHREYSIPFAMAATALMYAHRPTAPDLVPPPGGHDAGARPRPIA
jgi:hypothetical protein